MRATARERIQTLAEAHKRGCRQHRLAFANAFRIVELALAAAQALLLGSEAGLQPKKLRLTADHLRLPRGELRLERLDPLFGLVAAAPFGVGGFLSPRSELTLFLGDRLRAFLELAACAVSRRVPRPPLLECVHRC